MFGVLIHLLPFHFTSCFSFTFFHLSNPPRTLCQITFLSTTSWLAPQIKQWCISTCSFLFSHSLLLHSLILLPRCNERAQNLKFAVNNVFPSSSGTPSFLTRSHTRLRFLTATILLLWPSVNKNFCLHNPVHRKSVNVIRYACTGGASSKCLTCSYQLS